MSPRCLLSLLIVLPLVAGCPAEPPSETSTDAPSNSGDTVSGELGQRDAVGSDVPTVSACPSGYATLTFTVDDTANRTYGPGELIWTGSFAHDTATNTITYATSWLPQEGPYPVLFDDGPLSAGGHEPEGATAGDGIWGVAVCYLADQSRTFAYGLLNEELRWIWTGPNGQLEIAEGNETLIEVPGQTVAPHGFNDLRLTLDMANIHPDYAVIDDSYRTFVKGTMNSWTPIQLLDDGQLGDAVAGDGIFTYQHSLFLGKHDGLLTNAQQSQFVFVFAKGELEPDDGLEYKVDGDAVVDGVGADGYCNGAWQVLDVALALDSKGIGLNTAAVMCSGSGPECGPEDPCPAGQTCAGGSCVTAQCGDGNPCPDGQQCIGGSCVTPECSDSNPCPDGQQCVDSVCVVAPECDAMTPCPDDQECIAGICVGTSECSPNNPCAEGLECVNGTCVASSGMKPELVLVLPSFGSAAGGSSVELLGENFEAGLTVRFGATEATVQAVSSQQIQVTTPVGNIGVVDVTVTNPGGKFSTYPDGFTYVEGAAAPVIDAVTPSVGPTGGGSSVTLTGSNFAAGATVVFGTQTAADVAVTPTSIQCVSPANPVGPVTITVTNPDGQKSQLQEGFTYTPAIPTWGRLNAPLSVETVAGFEANALQGQVYEGGMTDAEGQGFGITAEVGFGPLGSDPTATPGDWAFVAAAYVGDLGNDDLYSGALTIGTEGVYSATMRFSVNGGAAWLYVDATGADDGFQPESLATMTVTAASGVQIASVTPNPVSPLGGQTVTLTGPGIAADCSISVDGTVTSSTFVDAGLQFTAPSRPQGQAQLSVDCPGGSASSPLDYEGTWDGNLDEWPESSQLAVIDDAANASAWGSDNYLEALHAATDGENLYIGIRGLSSNGGFGDNAISVFIDTDPGNGTGISDTSIVTDMDGTVDNALTGALNITVADYGADFAFASLSMGSYSPGLDDPGTALAGWRQFIAPFDDLYWHTEAAVIASAAHQGIEAWIPLSVLLGSPTGANVAFQIIVRLGNADGSSLSNQALPLAVSGQNNVNADAAATLSFVY